jgi:hypothetical protein
LRQNLDAKLSNMPLKSPEALDPREEELEAEEAREALQEAISGLSLPDPERYMRANMRADGRKTPETRSVFFRGYRYSAKLSREANASKASPALPNPPPTFAAPAPLPRPTSRATPPLSPSTTSS